MANPKSQSNAQTAAPVFAGRKAGKRAKMPANPKDICPVAWEQYVYAKSNASRAQLDICAAVAYGDKKARDRAQAEFEAAEREADYAMSDFRRIVRMEANDTDTAAASVRLFGTTGAGN